MKITKFIKKKEDKYEIILEDNSKVEIYQDSILEYNLLITKTIDDKTLEKIKNDNEYYNAYELSIKYISKRIRCEKEVYDYLYKKEITSNIIKDVINKLKQNKILDDSVFVKAYSKDKFNFNDYGPNKIKKELEKLNIDKNIIEENIDISREEILDKLNKLIDKKTKQLKNYNGNILKLKIEQFFINKGYSKEDIDNVFNNKDIDNSDNYQKEYDKLYKKYSSKYEGKELEFKIKQKLYEKGFIK